MQRQHIVITGASSGIGKALAEAYAAPENSLYLIARNEESLKNVARQCEASGARVVICVADLAKQSELEKAAACIMQHTHFITILCNNAGISQRSLAEETQASVDREIMELNFFSPVVFTKLLWPLLIASEKASVVNISSVTGTFGFPQRSAYAASKHALEGFFESWMLENNRKHIHFLTVAPGRVQTSISLSARKADGSMHNTMDSGQLNGIPASVCARKIMHAISRNKRKVYIVSSERVLIFLHRFFPTVFVYLVKKLGLH